MIDNEVDVRPGMTTALSQNSGSPVRGYTICLMATFGKCWYRDISTMLKRFVVPIAPNDPRDVITRRLRTNPSWSPHAWTIACTVQKIHHEFRDPGHNFRVSW